MSVGGLQFSRAENQKRLAECGIEFEQAVTLL